MATAAIMLLAGTALPAVANVAEKPATTWGTNGRVAAVLVVGSRIFIGGSFSAVVTPSGATRNAANLAVISANTGAVDLSWQGGVNGDVTALALADGRLFAGGDFSSANGQSRRNLAAFDPSTGTAQSWKVSMNRPVDALTAVGTSLYASGRFTDVTDSSGRHSRSFLAKLNTGSPALDRGWAPSPDARVRALTASADGDTIYAGGDFTTVSGAGGTRNMVALSAATGAVDSGFTSAANNGKNFATVLGLTADNKNVYEAVGGGGGACTAVNAVTGKRVWSVHSNGNIHSVIRHESELFCGGHFSGDGSFGGLTRYKLAAVDVASGLPLPFAPRVNSPLGVWALDVDAGHLYAGGDFTQVGNAKAPHFAAFPG